MTESDNKHKTRLEDYEKLSRNSLVKVQYSCGGNSTGIDEQENIPIVSSSFRSVGSVAIKPANEEDVVGIINLLKANNLPVSDLSSGKRQFLVATISGQLTGVVALELYGDSGLLRSLAVNSEFRTLNLGKKLVAEAENLGRENGLKQLFLLTTTASGFFSKLGWDITDRSAAPASISASTEFSSVCPASAVCMTKKLL
jgi:amino-acid N-acetyltransferase